MLFGEYPCCWASFVSGLPDVTLPAFGRECCPECGQIVWHKFSRVDPQSWTESSFLEFYSVDEKSLKITAGGEAHE